jgi:hypothetical protein
MPMDTKRTLAFLLIVIAAEAFIAPTIAPYAARRSNRSATLEQGRYLVDSVTICFECHSERDFSKPGWPIPPGRVGSGRILWGEGSPNQVIAPNITPDVATGIGEWSDEEIVRAIKDGIGKNGRLLNPEMPSRYFHSLAGCGKIVLSQQFLGRFESCGSFEHLRRDFSCYLAPQRSVAAPFRDTTAGSNYVGTTLCIRFRMRTKL